MVSQDSPPNPTSSNLRQFLLSGSIANQNQFQNQHFNAFGADLRGDSAYPQSLNVLPSIQSLGERMSRSIDLVHGRPMGEESEINHTGQFTDLLGASNETNHQGQRLSLSLGSWMLVPPVQYSPGYLNSGEELREGCNRGDYSFAGSAFASSSTSLNQTSSSFYGTESFAIAVGNSKYLEPAQSLLYEVVSVGGNAIDLSNETFVKRLSSGGKRGSRRLCSELKAELCNNVNGLSMENHELQATLAKLISLLEEVERKYEQYYHHMEELVSSFEVIAGLRAGKSYTALALQAMSRHFCCLRDAIISQINVTKRKISQDMLRINRGLSQLSLFDQENRHNRVSLQQLGMIQSPRQTWRPIRGLPETSVAILRSWLFEHFLHPYPNDNEKLMLSSQTGLTKNQVSNWFINARVRLWKPMIEEMYKEEFADDSNPLLASSSITREGITDHEEE